MPYDSRIAFLESSGRQYVDTGLVVDQDTHIRAVFTLMAPVNTITWFFGALGTGTSTRYGLMGHYLNAGLQILFKSQSRPFAGMWTEGARVSVDFDKNIFTLNVDGVVTVTTFTLSPFSSVTTLLLFAASQSIGPQGFASMRFETFQAWSNDVLVLDYYPVRVGDVGYMYDQVTGALLGNSGSGSFILGPDV